MKRFYFLVLLLMSPFCLLRGFDKVVIWGHKLHSHTHSYIHNGFYRAFQHLGYPTYWFDDEDDVSAFDFKSSLFLTEGQVDRNIPLREDCQYILHYCHSSKYLPFIEKGNCIFMQVYNKELALFDSLGKKIPGSEPDASQIIVKDRCFAYDPKGKRAYMPWATDLLPHEIDQIMLSLPEIKETRENIVYWVGTISDGPGSNRGEIDPFIRACRENGVGFVHKNPWSQERGVSLEENIRLSQRSYLAPAIVGTWQNEVGYIPCRIFKNISYGQMGITNSKEVYDLFEGKVVYNLDTHQLFYDAKERLKTLTKEELSDLMNFVKTKHTYINRIEFLLEFFRLLENTK